MKIRKSFIVFGILTLFTSKILAEPKNVKDVVPAKYYDQLMKDGLVRIIHSEDDVENLYLLPESSYKEKVLNNVVEKNPKLYPFVTESLFCISKDEIRNASGSEKTDFNISDVSVVFRSVSKMVGLTYYSNTRKREEVLYKEVYMVEDPKTRKQIDDPVEGSSDENVYYCVQRDASFGKCLYRLDYFENDNAFFGCFTNIDKMGIGPFSAIATGDMKISAVIVDCGDNFILYFETDCNSLRFPGVAGVLEDSLVSRMDSLKKWFVSTFN